MSLSPSNSHTIVLDMSDSSLSIWSNTKDFNIPKTKVGENSSSKIQQQNSEVISDLSKLAAQEIVISEKQSYLNAEIANQEAQMVKSTLNFEQERIFQQSENQSQNHVLALISN